MTALFDSHCHVDEEKFDQDRDAVLQRMAENGVTRMAVVGSDMATSAMGWPLRRNIRDVWPWWAYIPMRPKASGKLTCSIWRTGIPLDRPRPLEKSAWTTITILVRGRSSGGVRCADQSWPIPWGRRRCSISGMPTGICWHCSAPALPACPGVSSIAIPGSLGVREDH